MDRIKQIWIESSRSSSPLDDSHMFRENTDMMMRYHHRPPPLRTCSTYDDDETFHKVGLNLLSRYETTAATHSSTKDILLTTLQSPKQRASFLEGLSLRLDRCMTQNNNNNNNIVMINPQLIMALETTFGKDLRDLVIVEMSASSNHHNHHPAAMQANFPFYSTNNPVAPRHHPTRSSTHLTQPTDHSQNNNNNHPFNDDNITITMSSSSMSSGSHNSRCNTSSMIQQQVHVPKKKAPRRFFPDTSDILLFRGSHNKRRVQNIDWKLIDCVKQVESLQLDNSSTTPPPSQHNHTLKMTSYEPPLPFHHPGM